LYASGYFKPAFYLSEHLRRNKVTEEKPKEKVTQANTPPLVPERLPENDAFLFACNWADWTEGFFIKPYRKIRWS
jgi:hypothetical protein